MEKITQAKKSVILHKPFFSADLFRGNGLQADNKRTDTMCTDGVNKYYNTEFVEKHSVPNLVFVICHEILHERFCHMTWMKGKHARIANMAADYVINMILKDFGMKLPENLLYDEQYRNWDKDKIYQKLLKEAQDEQKKQDDQDQDDQDQDGDQDDQDQDGDQDGDQDDQDQDGDQDDQDDQDGDQDDQDQDDQDDQDQDDQDGDQGNGTGKPELKHPLDKGDWNIGEAQPYEGPKSEKELEQEGKQRLIEGARMEKSKNMGNLPGYIKELIKQFVDEPALSWEDILMDYLRTKFEGELSYERLNRNYLHHDIYLPDEIGLHGKAIVHLDTSCSIDEEMVGRFLTQAGYVLNQCDMKVDLVQSDMEIQDIQYDITYIDPETTIKGGGGTDFRPFFKLIEEGEITGDVVLFFTDMYGRFPEEEPMVPVIWLDYAYYPGKSEPPFGTRIAVNDI